MKTLFAVIACAGLLGGCAVAPYDATYGYSYGYDAPYAYGPYYDYGPYYYGPGYYGYYSSPVIVGGVRYYSHGRHDWRDHDRGDRNWRDRSAWREHHGGDRTVRPTTAPATGAMHWNGNGRMANAPANRSTRSVTPAQRPARNHAQPMNRAQSPETRRNS